MLKHKQESTFNAKWIRCLYYTKYSGLKIMYKTVTRHCTHTAFCETQVQK